MQAMRRKFMRFGLMISPSDPLHDDPQNALADKVLADAVALLSATSSWNASDALTAIQGKRKRMMDNQEADEDELEPDRAHGPANLLTATARSPELLSSPGHEVSRTGR